MGATYTPAEAQAREQAHRERAAQWVDPHLERRTRGEKHPVWDFLFDYYPFAPSQLSRWHPGLGTTLIDATSTDHKDLPFYAVDATGAVRLDRAAYLAKRGEDARRIRELLVRTARRQPHFDCFGMHEWAMVYRTAKPRHDLALRLGEGGTNAVVDAHQLKCSHFDAYRFFTPAAKPLNLTVLQREDQVDYDQPGCVHVAMDLYKWAAKLGPVVPGELLLDTFALAVEARTLDMEASPYDCTPLGFGVVAVETPEGKAQYVARQRQLAAAAAPLRAQLVALLDELFQPALSERRAM